MTLAENTHMKSRMSRKTGRGGRALLAGLLRCRRCGRMLHVQYGGNGDGTMSAAELQSWEDGEFQDDAFGDLATGRKVGAITTAVTGVGLYIWNIIDARSSARSHNRQVMQRRFDLGMTTSENQTGLALNMHF